MASKSTAKVQSIEDLLKQAGEMYDAERYEEAMDLYRPLAEKGNALAQHKMGRMYDDGHGVKKNDETAVYWFSLAAKQDYIDSIFNLAGFYLTGEGGCDLSYDRAYYWFKRAYELDDDMDCYEKMSAIEDSISGDGSEPSIKVGGFEFEDLAAASAEYTNDLSAKKKKELLEFLRRRRQFNEYFDAAEETARQEGAKAITLSHLADAVDYSHAYLFLSAIYSWSAKLNP